MTDGPASSPVGGAAPLPGDLAAAVELGGEMGRRFAEFDWAAHPLGLPAQWSSDVRTAVAMTLTSRFPTGLLVGAPDLFYVYNDACIPILANKHPAALGQLGRQVWWDIWDTVGPMFDAVMETGKATGSGDVMLPLVTAGRPEERYFTLTFSPVIGERGAVSGVFVVAIEITDRVRSERRLMLLNAVGSAAMAARGVDEVVRAAVAACAAQPADLPFIAVYGTGSGRVDGGLHAATPSMLPVLPDTVSGLTDWGSTGSSRAAERIVGAVAEVLPRAQRVLGDYCPEQALVLPVGEGSTSGALVLGISPWLRLDAQYRGFCQLLADQLSLALAASTSYEDQCQRADALAELDQAKTTLLTHVSHEFRTPLTLLHGPLEDALADAKPGTVLAERLAMAQRNAGRLVRMVDALLDFSGVEVGCATAQLVCTEVGALTAAIALSFSELCDRAGLELIVDCDPVLVDIDPALWETIVLNLLSNAVKYTLSGSITVEVRGAAAQCWVAVRDTGVGIAEADRQHLFERFFRASNARARSVAGTGIGLPLVRGLVELQQGTVAIESELERGTTVTIRLPRSLRGLPTEQPPTGLVDQDNPYIAEARQWLAPAATPAAPAAAAAGDQRRGLVLIADDNADMRAHLDRVLSAHWDTVLAADGESALAAARDLHPDAIVTDVMMPGLDGFGLVAVLRADPALASTPVLMLSALAGAAAASAGFAGGADDYLPKPFRSQELVDRVAARLAAARRERQQRATQRRIAVGLAQLEAALQGAESVTAILAALFNSPTASGGASAVTISLLDEKEGVLRAQSIGALPTELRDRYHVAPLDAPLLTVDVINSGEPMIITDTLGLAARYHHAAHDAASFVRACVVQPLSGSAGRVIGALTLMWPIRRDFDPDEIEIFTRTADSIQGALERVRSVEREHQIAAQFQEELLDLDRSSTAAAVAARYQPAGEAMRVGGDWYLVTPLERPGQIVICVGDAVGHGLPAAIVMSKLRAAVAATALTDADPAGVLAMLDRYAATITGARCATVGYAVIDTAAGSDAAMISYLCAGHPYPLLVTPGCPPSFLEAGRRPPLAAQPARPQDQAATAELPPDSVVILYTDGLIERRGESLDQGFARLLLAAADCADLPVGAVCDALLERMAPPGGYTDDVVVLALRPSHSTARGFTAVLPAAFANLPEVRERFGRWLNTVVADPQLESDILLATSEALTNAVEHGSLGDASKKVTVEAFARGAAVTATVSDSGCWSGDSAASLRQRGRGRGLVLINGLADSVETVRSAAGTRMTLRFDLAVGPKAMPAPGEAVTLGPDSAQLR